MKTLCTNASISLIVWKSKVRVIEMMRRVLQDEVTSGGHGRTAIAGIVGSNITWGTAVST
jgi:hypothetical protein